MAICEAGGTTDETTWKGRGLFSLRGCWTAKNGRRYASLVVSVEEPRGEILALSLPEDCMPYLPDMSSGSQFERDGKWHHYSAEKQPYEIVTVQNGKLLDVRRVVLGGDLIYDRNRDGA